MTFHQPNYSFLFFPNLGVQDLVPIFLPIVCHFCYMQSRKTFSVCKVWHLPSIQSLQNWQNSLTTISHFSEIRLRNGLEKIYCHERSSFVVYYWGMTFQDNKTKSSTLGGDVISVTRWFGGEVTRPPSHQVWGLAIPSNEQGWVVLSSGQISIQWTAPFVSLIILIRWIVV